MVENEEVKRMREIKFRAWFELENKIVESENLGLQYEGDEEQPFTFAFDKNDLIEQENGDVHEKGTLCFELMQYTEIKDINKTEIYEGDVVDYLGDIELVNSNVLRVIEYKNEEACFVARLPVGVDGEEAVYLNEHDFKVVGNIYENPELLGDSK